MKTKVVIAGAAGRMGQALVRCSQKMEDIELVGATEHDQHEALGQDVGEIAGIGPVGVTLTANLSEALAEADVVIDFTYHTAVPVNVKTAAAMGRAAVVGTTALDETETAVVERAADKVPIVWAPNMSLGVNLLFAMSKRAAAVLGSGYAVTIDDTHHIHKLDAPSGTALRLGEKVAEGAGVNFKDVYIHDEGGKQASYPAGSIPIRSYREGEVVGDHTVAFENEGERIELTHHAWSRDAFAMGALHAAKWVSTRRPRMYDMQDVLGLGE
jgi:4-hydroxy-tetrahydrodipicolinate reductase